MNRDLTAGVMGVGSVGAVLAAYALLVRPWHLRWGATDDELQQRLPGDEVVPYSKHEATHAITINATVAEVWPWLTQIGQTRGGFYSYTGLENLVGCEMHNADRVVPEWQDLRVGDVVWLHPKAPPLPVIIVEPFKAIVLGDNFGTWGLFLKAIDGKTTRLRVRTRWDRKPGILDWVSKYILLEPSHFIMERKMMLGIKQRAEALHKHLEASSSTEAHEDTRHENVFVKSASSTAR
ncbi:MAG TPA: hypothetical protein VFF31_16485 [Blastocatellia bacterium]|nr:hypothetical protein [Blastocatellia bacterium]